MASNTAVTENRRQRRHKNMGRARKVALSQRSTLSNAELFAGCGECGKPAPAANAAK